MTIPITIEERNMMIVQSRIGEEPSWMGWKQWSNGKQYMSKHRRSYLYQHAHGPKSSEYSMEESWITALSYPLCWFPLRWVVE